MQEYTVEKVKDYTNTAHVIFEHEIDINGYSYLIIFGRHINGGFISIPNWRIGTKMASDGAIIYNTEQLEHCGLDPATALTIARYISETLESMQTKE